MSKKKLITRLLTILFYVVLAYFFIKYIASLDFSTLAHAQFMPLYAVYAAITALAARYLMSYIWVRILRSLHGTGVSWSRNLIYVYAKSWLGRYVPGKLPWILGKIYFASKYGIPKDKLAVSSLLEAGIQTVSMIVFSMLILAFDSRLNVIDNQISVLMYVSGFVGIALLVPPVFNYVLKTTYRVIKKGKAIAHVDVSWSTIIHGSWQYMAVSVLSGLSLFFLAKSVYPELQMEHMLFIIGAGTLASVVGMLAIFTPSGLGVREGIMLALLAVILPPEIALVIVVATRLWEVVMDGMFFIVSLLLQKISARKSAQITSD